MAIIALMTEINAPVERCFDLSRSIDLHQHSTTGTNERAIAGVTSGLIRLNETVTWRAKHFGINQNLTSKITELNFPNYFTDVMVKGAFRRMEHLHSFEASGNKTIMKDRFEFEAPLGFIGRFAEKVFLTSYLKKFLMNRNQFIKETAESGSWKNFLP